jgi:hypothetical protein
MEIEPFLINIGITSSQSLANNLVGLPLKTITEVKAITILVLNQFLIPLLHLGE